MFKTARCREMVCPLLRAAREFVTPAQGRSTHERALAVVAGKEAVIEPAEARLGTGRYERDGCQNRDFSCLEADVLHAQIPETGEKLTRGS